MDEKVVVLGLRNDKDNAFKLNGEIVVSQGTNLMHEMESAWRKPHAAK